ncbi:MAG: amidase [Cyclobacteriaceae bacterium]|jgi:Asp-tRNA(Asn)/Glu-tRNA(Gln) amidotransferase A subunit family amidase|nr:amidase [Cyclobacteriaceae bacterium]
MKAHSIYTVYFILAVCLSTQSGFSQKKYPTADIEPYYDLSFTQAERDSLLRGLEDYQKAFQTIHQFKLANSTGMSLVFDPIPTGMQLETIQKPIDWGLPKDVAMPANKEELAFYPVYKLAVLLKNKKITSTELTKLYLSRIKKYGDTLQCVITLLEETALAQAKKADDEIAKGKYRGPLHGIPYGIKDLLSVEGVETTWGAAPYKDQVFSETATVVKKLEAAGAVLIVKLSMGALAMGDIWFGGVTKNPWNLKEGSSGSSAGSASATVAGLVAFAIGTETLGSIVSPSTRCGASGLRPTFGRVSKYGAMALSWSMDKIGPLTRSALDCAIVFDAIRGTDGLDNQVRVAAFNYSARTDLKKLKVGYLKTLFDAKYPTKANDEKALEVIKSFGVELIPVELLTDIPVSALRLMLTAEAAAAFDELTRSNRDSLLVNQSQWAWPNSFRTARFIPAVEYINASRIRQQLIQEYYAITKDFDVIIAPSFGGTQLLTTNLTGHPCVVVPNGYNDKGSPTSISFLGKLYGEATIVSLAHAYQQATEWENKVPPLFK